MSLDLVLHEWNSNSGMCRLFQERSATRFLSRSPSFDFDDVARTWLINTTARGQTPADKGLSFCVHGTRARKQKKKSNMTGNLTGPDLFILEVKFSY